jgi:uncharacterized membrane protein YgcG
VLGHEISHVSLGHCIGRLQYELAARRIAGDDFAEIVGFAHQLFSAAYNREQETEADRNGVLLAAAAGYDPRAVIDAMRLLASMETQAEQAGTVGGQILQSVGETIGDYARSHPPAEQRIADLETLIDRNASTWQGKQFYLGAREYAQAVTHEPGDYHDWRVFTSAQPAPSIPPSFPDLTGRVVDQADVIPSKVKAVIDNRLALIEWETGDKFVVATVRSLQGYDIHDYGFRLSQHWGGPGKDGKSVLLVVAPGEHQVDIEFGYGVRLSGAQAKEIIQKTIQPRFDAGDIIAGIERGVDDVIRVLSGNAIEIDGRAVSAASGTPASPSARSASLGPTFPDLTGRVVDQADVIPAKIKAAIEEKLATFEEATTNQFVVATVKSLEDYAIPTYARQLGQHWDIFGVGNKGKGVLLVVAPNEHQVDIEVGYGLNMTLSAAQAQEIIQKTILPRLLADDMAGGIERGVDEMIQILAGKE